ncbi:MAG: hypothetical protein ACKVVT_07770 [Dehalococcoidia bacterium]
MIIRRFGARRLMAAGLIAGGSVAAFAFAAANVVPESGAGDGNDTISGYTITNVEYNLESNPVFIDSWEFDIAPTDGAAAARVVKAKVVGATTTYVDCTVSSGHATCDAPTGTITVLSTDNLRVIAVQ